MKVKFDAFFRGCIVFVVFTLVWAVWAGAQTATNGANGATNDQPSLLVKEVERLEVHPLTFGLDRLPILREVRLLGEPLWKYLASLIYILLAFYVSKLIDFIVRIRLKKF